jgi:hypothetical protein
MTFHSQRMMTFGLALEVSSNLGLEVNNFNRPRAICPSIVYSLLITTL